MPAFIATAARRRIDNARAPTSVLERIISDIWAQVSHVLEGIK